MNTTGNSHSLSADHLLEGRRHAKVTHQPHRSRVGNQTPVVIKSLGPAGPAGHIATGLGAVRWVWGLGVARRERGGAAAAARGWCNYGAYVGGGELDFSPPLLPLALLLPPAPSRRGPLCGEPNILEGACPPLPLSPSPPLPPLPLSTSPPLPLSPSPPLPFPAPRPSPSHGYQ